MYSSCLFCRGRLGRNQAIETFPVGRRLAFDAAKGRLWVVCRRCGRWNLTPLDERWEAIEECERRFRGTALRVSTANVGLARLAEGLELVRIGKPLRPEFAAWRYGDQFGRRRRTAVVVGGVGAVAAVAAAPVAIAASSFLGSMVLTSWVAPWLTVPYATIKDYVQSERVVARLGTPNGTVRVRVRQLRDSRLRADRPGGDVDLDLAHDRGRECLTGSAALHALGVLLAGTNILGGTRGDVQRAVDRIEGVGDPAHFFVAASRVSNRIGGRVMGKMRGIGALNLSPVEQLALEMAAHEEAERRAMQGELAQLEEAWRGAEEIAAIADSLLLPPDVADRLRQDPL